MSHLSECVTEGKHATKDIEQTKQQGEQIIVKNTASLWYFVLRRN